MIAQWKLESTNAIESLVEEVCQNIRKLQKFKMSLILRYAVQSNFQSLERVTFMIYLFM